MLGCGITALVLIIASGWLAYKILKTPSMRGFVEETVQCRDQLTDIHAALIRYEASNRRFPAELSDLVPDYLESKEIFHCPSDKTPGGEQSYNYRRPTEDTPGSAIILSCSHHFLPNGDGMTLSIRKNGRFANERARR